MPIEIPSLFEVYIEVAVAMLGFSGIIAALQTRGGSEWETPDLVRFQFLVTASCAAVIFNAMPGLLATAHLPEADIWRYSSLVVLGIGFPAGTNRIYQLRNTKNLKLAIAQATVMWAFISLSAYVAIGWVYLALMTVFLILLFMVFVNLVVKLATGKQTMGKQGDL